MQSPCQSSVRAHGRGKRRLFVRCGSGRFVSRPHAQSPRRATSRIYPRSLQATRQCIGQQTVECLWRLGLSSRSREGTTSNTDLGWPLRSATELELHFQPATTQSVHAMSPVKVDTVRLANRPCRSRGCVWEEPGVEGLRSRVQMPAQRCPLCSDLWGGSPLFRPWPAHRVREAPMAG